MQRSGSSQNSTEFALLGLLALLWGSSYLFIGVAVEHIPPITLIAFRVALAALLMLVVVRMTDRRLPGFGPIWALIFIQAFLNSFGAWTLLAWGQQFVDSGLAGVLNSTSPIFVVCATLMLGQAGSTGLRKVSGVIIGLVGVVLIMGPSVLGGLGEQLLAQSAILLGAICYAGAALHGRRFRDLPPSATAAATLVAASIVLVPISLVVDRPWTLRPPVHATLAAVCLSVLCTALALAIYFRLLRTLGALGTASQAYLRSVVAVALGIVILGERFELIVGLGTLAAIVGVVLINLPAQKGD